MQRVKKPFFRDLVGTLLLLLVSVPLASATVINVSNSAQLDQALAMAIGGDTIRLASGNYTANVPNSNTFQIAGYDYSSYVTITSETNSSPAQFNTLHIVDSSYIRLENLKVVHSGREGIGVFNGSHHIEVLNLEVHAAIRFDRAAPHYSQVESIYGVYVNGHLGELTSQGFSAEDVRELRIENVDVQDAKSSGYVFFNVRDSIIKGNRCDWMAADCYKLGGVDNLDFINNFGASNIHSSPTAHVDFVQGQGEVSNSRFIGNVALAGTEQHFQGLFFDDATYTNLTFENNLIHAPSIRGISVSSPNNGAPSSGIVARFNTVLRPAVASNNENSNKASLILIPSGSIQENNIVANITTKTEQRFTGQPGRENIVSQYNKPDSDYFYNDYYLNAARGRGAVIADFQPVSGSFGETKGAFARINELLNGGGGNPPPDSPSSTSIMGAIMLLLEDD